MRDELWTKYSRQILFSGIGEEGQRRLCESRLAVVGCGALGSAQANALARAGVGFLRIIDRDFVEESNLQRQMLFDEADARDSLPKAVAAERKLRQINSAVRVEGVVADLVPENGEALLGDCELFLDGTDNFETRRLINDIAVKLGRPWIYGAVVASYGITMPIVPGKTACLTCLVEPEPERGGEETCDTVGVINPAVTWVAALQVSQALQLLTGHWSADKARLHRGDLWKNDFHSSPLPAPRPDCLTCRRREFLYLEGAAQPQITLCGRNSVQIHEHARRLNLAELRARLAAHGEVRNNDYLLRLSVPPYELTVFADGRAIIRGTTDPGLARSLYARYIGA
ncbi:MAG TPA: ThiF family adenylyltransferase [Candidatus Xenobia bacterium]|nr:ThiF family adenylyltransferase [Candidatus Xenobia bacterium]